MAEFIITSMSMKDQKMRIFFPLSNLFCRFLLLLLIPYPGISRTIPHAPGPVAESFSQITDAAGGSASGSYINGYQRSVKGGGFLYHAPVPGVSSSLLLRSVDSLQFIEWQTDPVNLAENQAFVKIIWMFGIDANSDSHRFRLFFNNSYCLTFSNPLVSSRSAWKVAGINGSQLEFKPVMLDKYNDPMGYAIFTVPRSLILSGKSQNIRILGESAGSRTWYMTFEASVEEKMEMIQEPCLIRGDKVNFNQVLFRFINPGDTLKGTLHCSELHPVDLKLEPGFTQIELLFPGVDREKSLTAEVRLDGRAPETLTFSIEPVQEMIICLVQHTHTDIGYTRPQTEILPEHLRYIDYALDYCDQTDSLPDDARFRWTCETTWAVREFLKCRPSGQVERLRRRVQEGRIEVAGLYLNSSDLADEPTIAATLSPVRELRQIGMPVQAAMQSDINGIPQVYIDYLSNAGIKYLNMAQNTHRALKPFSRPTTFWWVSRSGNRLLVNRPEHYMMGNSLGVLTNSETFGKNLFNHLRDLRSKGYPYSCYAVQFSGYLTDNSPPSTTACNLVESWNKRYVWPHLRLATISEFCRIMERDHGKELPIETGAWPDWWMDGFGSAAIPTAYARKAHTDHIADRSLQAMVRLLGGQTGEHAASLQHQINDDLAFYDEHTFGAAESISEPLAENTIVQIGQKESYVWEAVKKEHLFREAVMGRIQPFLSRSSVPTLTVFNTLNWTRSAEVIVYIDHQIIPSDRMFKITDGHQPLDCQPVASREDGTYWLIRAVNLPPLGYQTYRILVADEPRSQKSGEPAHGVFENQYYRLKFDSLSGKITHLTDKELSLELLDSNEKWPLGTVIYERLGKNRSQLELLKLEDYTRTAWTGLKVGELKRGPVFNSIIIKGIIEGCADQSVIICEIRLYNNEKKLEFCYSMKKLPVTDPEGVYVSFPFNLVQGRHVAELAGGSMVPGTGQIEGSSTDWLGIQNYVALRNDRAQIIMSSPEIPLFQLGAINLGSFARKYEPESGKIFSWVLNNYWTTNFFAKQEGELKWSYQVTSSADTSDCLAARFGWSNRIPLLTRILPAGKTNEEQPLRNSFFPENQSGILLVASYPASDGTGVIMHLRETEGHPNSGSGPGSRLSVTSLAKACNAKAIEEVNVVEETRKVIWSRPDEKNTEKVAPAIVFHPYETKFLKLILDN